MMAVAIPAFPVFNANGPLLATGARLVISQRRHWGADRMLPCPGSNLSHPSRESKGVSMARDTGAARCGDV